MIKFRTIILIFLLWGLATTVVIFALKTMPPKVESPGQAIVIPPVPSIGEIQVSPGALTIKPPTTEYGNYSGYPTYEMYRKTQILSLIDEKSVPDSWVEIKRKDLGILLKVPSDYKDIPSNLEVHKNYLNLTLGNTTVSTGYGYFPLDLYNNKSNADFSFTPNEFKIYVVDNSREGENQMIAAIELPYLSEQRYLFFNFSLIDLSMFTKVVAGMSKLPITEVAYTEKTYTNTEIGFRAKFPVPKNTGYSLEESFVPGPRGSFNVGIKNGFGISGIPKDYTCECDAYVINSFPKSSELFPVQHITNKNGVEYGIMTSNLKAEDDMLGESPHAGDKIYIIKTKNKDFPVLTIWANNTFDESIAKFIVDSFELI